MKHEQKKTILIYTGQSITKKITFLFILILKNVYIHVNSYVMHWACAIYKIELNYI